MSIRGFIDRIRHTPKPKWTAPQGNGRCHDDWQSGDLALCIDTRPWIDLATGIEAPGPDNGDVLRVAGIKMARGFVFLKFHGVLEWFSANSFRKVTPRQNEACTDDFKRQMKDCRPKVGA